MKKKLKQIKYTFKVTYYDTDFFFLTGSQLQARIEKSAVPNQDRGKYRSYFYQKGFSKHNKLFNVKTNLGLRKRFFEKQLKPNKAESRLAGKATEALVQIISAAVTE